MFAPLALKCVSARPFFHANQLLTQNSRTSNTGEYYHATKSIVAVVARCIGSKTYRRCCRGPITCHGNPCLRSLASSAIEYRRISCDFKCRYVASVGNATHTNYPKTSISMRHTETPKSFGWCRRNRTRDRRLRSSLLACRRRSVHESVQRLYALDLTSPTQNWMTVRLGPRPRRSCFPCSAESSDILTNNSDGAVAI
jgi:hypothetical protein